MGETKRIQWRTGEPGRIPRFTGSAGMLDENLFAIYEPEAPDGCWVLTPRLKTADGCWVLTSRLPGWHMRCFSGEPDVGPEALKDEAEAWLAEFISSLGASFEVPTLRATGDGT